MTSPTSDAHPTPLRRGDLPNGLWSGRHIFRHGQCDPAGIVYTPEFFNVFNQAVEAWFDEALGLSYYDLIGPRRTGLGYVDAQATFFAPVRMGEAVDIHVTVIRIGRTSFTLRLHAMMGEREALRGRLTTVTTDLACHRPVAIPDDLKHALTAYAERGIATE